MTSFGASKVLNEGFMPTFKVQGQIYHTIGSLLPIENEDSKFLQVYFIGNESDETNARLKNTNGLRRDIIEDLQKMFHEKNQLIKVFKYALENMPTDEYKLVLTADKTPVGIHKKCFSIPTCNDVAIIMVENENCSRDIILKHRDKSLHRVRETHKSYDALQYPVILWQGDDAYHFNLIQTNSTKKVRMCINDFSCKYSR